MDIKPKSIYEPLGNFSKDLHLFLEHIEYEPNELDKEWVKKCLMRRGIMIKYFDHIVSYCNENELIDVRKRKTGTLSIKINPKGVEELRELRSKKVLEKQNEILENQNIMNRFIAFGTVVLALSAATGPFTKPVALTVILGVGAMSVYNMLPPCIKRRLPFH